jgi:hypothetical protein
MPRFPLHCRNEGDDQQVADHGHGGGADADDDAQQQPWRQVGRQREAGRGEAEHGETTDEQRPVGLAALRQGAERRRAEQAEVVGGGHVADVVQPVRDLHDE